MCIRDRDYPVGWLWKGQPWNHNNMDVVTLFQCGWPTAAEEQRKAMRTEIENMLHWCLADSLQPDGSFKPVIADGSLEEGMESVSYTHLDVYKRQPLGVRQLARPRPCFAPTIKPPLSIPGTTATHSADPSTCCGIPLSGAP